jgi:hypothetical protein
MILGVPLPIGSLFQQTALSVTPPKYTLSFLSWAVYPPLHRTPLNWPGFEYKPFTSKLLSQAVIELASLL